MGKEGFYNRRRRRPRSIVGIQERIDLAVVRGKKAHEIDEIEKRRREKEVAQFEKSDLSVINVIGALSGFKTEDFEVLWIEPTGIEEDIDVLNKGDARMGVRVKGLKRDQKVLVQVKSSYKYKKEFLGYYWGEDGDEEDAWKKLAKMSLLLFNARDSIEEIRKSFLIQMGRIVEFRKGQISI